MLTSSTVIPISPSNREEENSGVNRRGEEEEEIDREDVRDEESSDEEASVEDGRQIARKKEKKKIKKKKKKQSSEEEDDEDEERNVNGVIELDTWRRDEKESEIVLLDPQSSVHRSDGEERLSARSRGEAVSFMKSPFMYKRIDVVDYYASHADEDDDAWEYFVKHSGRGD